MLIIRNITYKIESFLYSLFLPLHMVNTWGTESVKLFHIPVVIMGLYCIATLPKYCNITAVKWLIGFIACSSLSFIIGGIYILQSYLTMTIIILSVIPFIKLDKTLFISLSPPLYLAALICSFLFADYSNVLFRFTGLYNDPNFLVMSIIFGDFICILALRQKKLVLSIISITAFIFSLYLLMLTQSRGGLIGFCIMLLLGLIELNKYNKKLATSIIAVAIVSSGSLAATYHKNIEKYAERFDGMTSGEEGSAKTRIIQFQTVIKGISEYPEIILLGIGVGKTHDSEIPKNKRPDDVVTSMYQYRHMIHITPLAVFFENGLLALVCYAAFLWNVFRKTIKSHNFFFLGLVLAMFMQSMTIPSLSYVPMWLSFMTCLSIPTILPIRN